MIVITKPVICLGFTIEDIHKISLTYKFNKELEDSILESIRTDRVRRNLEKI